MTLEDWEKAAVGVVVSAVGGLVALVRRGDVQRIESIEERQDKQEALIETSRDKLYQEVKELRRDVDRKHGELVALITERRT